MVARTLKVSCALFFWLAASSASSAELVIEKLRSPLGHVAVNIFTDRAEAAFPERANMAIQNHYVKVEGQGPMKIQLTDLPEGTYAVAVMHDEDSDKKFKSTIFSIPQEGFGFSNNPTIYFGPPAFKSVLVKIAPDSQISITMKYML